MTISNEVVKVLVDLRVIYFPRRMEGTWVKTYEEINVSPFLIADMVEGNRNKEIDTIEYKESLRMSYFQGFLTVYRY